ncbi:hypothetical protein AOL_s00081g243 [Orbilia oligospora ATCC 24927]|uniref:Uncharacterized protein n=1 Tax=Arthrobotrys oligospora (strain ATCC 24927 / CBS 115.81 / DSM 1491) TaxID=756982 RepID=G1XFV0_ARTOA|nr:hypothetical protein AOL_s00081g243 [Orbilia oligospora ATCC 24927]EGX47916.1 hypothetical protein AOL_s00081g243 [Orbilia oligospora ATCC 24927]
MEELLFMIKQTALAINDIDHIHKAFVRPIAQPEFPPLPSTAAIRFAVVWHVERIFEAVAVAPIPVPAWQRRRRREDLDRVIIRVTTFASFTSNKFDPETLLIIKSCLLSSPFVWYIAKICGSDLGFLGQIVDGSWKGFLVVIVPLVGWHFWYYGEKSRVWGFTAVGYDGEFWPTGP